MIEPKTYEYNVDIPISVLLKAGFELTGKNLRYTKALYRYNDTNTPYVELRIYIENGLNMTVSVTCNHGEIYMPFINPEMRHNNLVYEQVVTNYHNEMEKLVRKKILKHHREKKHHVRND